MFPQKSGIKRVQLYSENVTREFQNTCIHCTLKKKGTNVDTGYGTFSKGTNMYNLGTNM